MSRSITTRALPLLVAGVLATPGAAGADYLYSVFRQACTVDTSIKYSAADPIVATVHLEKSEVNRVSSNYMTYGGFSLYSGTESFRTTTTNNVSVRELTKTKGHLFALRLFKEDPPESNQWKFLPYDEKTVLDNCGPDKTCLFDAGKLLTDRDKRNKPRKIYSGKVGTPLTPTTGNEGAYTVPIVSTEPLVLTGLPTYAIRDWNLEQWYGTGWYQLADNALGSSEAVSTFKTNVWQPYVGLQKISDAMAGGLPKNLHSTVNSETKLKNPDNIKFARMLKWLHGEERDWDLGDVYHASAAVVEAPERYYRDNSYPEFKAKFEKRPEMIYVGANDGMIHAFHAGPDIYWQDDECTGPRWQAGEEAWAYLPANMLAKTLVHVERGDQRFFSQDLSCRFTDVMVDPDFETCTADDWDWPWESDDPYCGWRTVLMCGQGWGGSWYVALDVTDPAAPFRKDDGTMGCTRNDAKLPMRAMWEMTHLPSAANAPAMGRTWSLPFIGLVNYEGTARWLAGFGSGYNTDMKNCPKYSGGSCSANTSGTTTHVPYQSLAAFRTLNLDYDGAYPNHGDGIDDGDTTASENASTWVIDIATGEVLNRFTLPNQLAVVADIPAVDSDFNGLIDAAYVAGWKGALARIHFGDERTTSSSIGIGTNGSMCTVSTMSGQRVLANHPTAFGVPLRATSGASDIDKVMTVLGSGLNSGDDPDMQRNNGNFWDIDARFFQDDGSATCPTSSSIVCGANNWWSVNDNTNGQKPRLLGAPIFSRQANGDDWLIYTTWSPPGDQCSKEGYAMLWCLDVTDNNACKECNGFQAKGNRYNITLYAGEQPPSSPVSADGNIYIAGEGGPMQQGITNSDGTGPNANSFAPTGAVSARVTSWREVF